MRHLFFAVALLSSLLAHASGFAEDAVEIFEKDNLVAWCIVPFDDRDRTPDERAEMLNDLGISKYAYDYRAQHIPTFDAEMEAIKQHGIELTAWWFPTVLNDEAKLILDVLKRHDVKTQLWVTGSGGPTGNEVEQKARVKAEAARIRPIAEAAAEIGCEVGLYNHGGWFGEPENQIAIIKELHLPNVGIVYNLHHGHPHVDRFAELLETMKPFLLCLNLNGMTRDGDQIGQKILPLGEGELDAKLLKIIVESEYDGPIGILNHTQENAKDRLQDNLNGLSWLLPQINGKPAGEKPTPKTWKPPAKMGRMNPGTVLPGKADYRHPPITVRCRATLAQHDGYNILVASDEKRSGAHWEIFSMAGSGHFTAYLPGMEPDHVRSSAMICDGKPHDLAMLYEQDRVRLLVDGQTVADQKIQSKNAAAVPGGLGIGRLVEGTIRSAGSIESVDILKGIHEREGDAVPEESRLLSWRPETKDSLSDQLRQPVPEHSPELVAELMEMGRQGNPARGALVFSSAKFACINCHKIGERGGDVGPSLSKVSIDQKPEYLVESLLWPRQHVKKEFIAHAVITAEGKVLRGYVVEENDETLVLRDPTTGTVHQLAKEELEARQEVGTLMPDGLFAGMTPDQRRDILALVLNLGQEEKIAAKELDAILSHAQAHLHGPAKFPFDKAPLIAENWPNAGEPVNRDRIYDFYTKEAEYFRQGDQSVSLVPDFPGLDGGDQGHWGNQNEESWADGRWNETILGSVQCGIFRGAGVTVPRGVCVQLGGESNLACCFNPDTLQYDAVWKGGFVEFSSVRHGFMHGLKMVGTPLEKPAPTEGGQSPKYLGYYRVGSQIGFAYTINGTDYLDVPSGQGGSFQRQVFKLDEHPLMKQLPKASRQWPQKLTTAIQLGTRSPYTVDRIGMPFENPWNALLFCGGNAFLPDGSALVCTMQGDVWRVTDYESPSQQATWQRFASGLHHSLGLVVDDDGIFVLGRDQITRLHDLNNDGEADFYECFSNAYETSPAGHDFICGLERDDEGRFYFASGNQGVVRISADGQKADVIATGFRNPDGIGLAADGTITVPCSEGEWTPASMICAFQPGRNSGFQDGDDLIGGFNPPFFGYRGPRDDRAPDLPLVYLPRGLDNSSGGQVFIDSDRWGPVQGKMVHLSFGAGSHFLLLRDEVRGQLQGGLVLLPGDFRSGVHRGRFSPHDGQLYVTGMAGWGSYTPDDGSFERVRYTGDNVQLPVDFHVHENGIRVTFSDLLNAPISTAPGSHFAQCWNYRYGASYGSPEMSTLHPGMKGHDVLRIRSVTMLPDGKSIFLEIPEIQPANQLHLRLHPEGDHGVDLMLTVHALDEPFTEIIGYEPRTMPIARHPILTDLTLATKMEPNLHRRRLPNARMVMIEAGTNLSYKTREFRAKRGENIGVTFKNPDVVPHNFVVIKPGTLQRVGQMANKLVADPDAAARHYVPDTSDVIAYTDLVLPRDEYTIYFKVPDQPGHYPYLCTFPGHWLVMNGIIIAE
ncbi:MAG: hypothetical protein KDA80_01400 [Planctomycetaceae bacterium]|nr:hypothetical protein [Planctomycetaceae bacterium]